MRDSRDTVQQYWARKRWQRQQQQQQQQQQQSTANNIKKDHQVFTVEEYAKPHWFDPVDGRPLTSRDPAGRFVNPWMSWSTNGVHSVWNILHWRYQRAIREWKARGFMSFLPKDFMQMLFGSELAIGGSTNKSLGGGMNENPNNANVQQFQEPSSNEIAFTWIGHSTCLVKMGNATILTDPIFSHRCTPLPRVPGIGVARDVPPSMNLEDLPEHIDVCLVSHDHYDHMDQLTISKLRKRVHHWVLPKGLPEWMESRCSVDPDRMVELEWWESVHMVRSQVPDDQERTAAIKSPTWKIMKNASNQEDLSNTMTITCLPAQHWSSRNLFDRCKRLWCGFAVETQNQRSPIANASEKNEQDSIVQKFYFAGDTGMPGNGFPLFQQIGDFCGHGNYHRQPTTKTEKRPEESATGESSAISATKNTTTFRPFDLAAIPIGAYKPAFLMQEAHMNPEEAVRCCKQLQARKAVAIHWGTFALSEEPLMEPPEKLKEALALQENEQVDFVALPVGGSLRIPSIESNHDAVVSI